MNQRERRFPRKTLAVEFRGHDTTAVGQLVFEGADLSLGGSFLKSEVLLEPGEELAFEFAVPGIPRALRARSRVAWVRRFPSESEAPGMGVEFLAMDERDRSTLQQYLSTLE